MNRNLLHISRIFRIAVLSAMLALVIPAGAQHLPAGHRSSRQLRSDTTVTAIDSLYAPGELKAASITDADTLFLDLTPTDTVALKTKRKNSGYDVWIERKTSFNPDPTRAVWMAALFPGLGQLYNRRYWKIPIIVGGYMGLAYATSWNNNMLTDYTRAYRDIMDNDPDTNSYMNLFPPNTEESSLDKTWLTNVIQSRKNYFRRNRDLCIIAMVGVYLLAMVDAYVDASLSHFDITPDLSMDITPVLFQEVRGMKPSIGLNWAITF